MLTTMLNSRRKEVTLLWLLLLLCTSSRIWCADAGMIATTVMDASGTMRTIPGDITSGIVTVVTSPGTPSIVLPMLEEEDLLSPLSVLRDESSSSDTTQQLICQGCTLQKVSSSSDDEVVRCCCLSVCSTVSDAIIVEGITFADLETGLHNTRHARTLTALFRSRIATLPTPATTTTDSSSESASPNKQTLIVTVSGATDDDDTESYTSRIVSDIQTLFQAATVGSSMKQQDVNNFYDIRVIAVDEASSALTLATEAAQLASKGVPVRGLSTTLQSTLRQVREVAGLTSPDGLDSPQVVQATVALGSVFAKQSRVIRLKNAVWKSRIARGLLIDGFGRTASSLRQSVLNSFDTETLRGAGLPSVAAYRKELRNQLQELVDTCIQQAFAGQVANLEKLTLKRFNTALLATVNSKESVETITTNNAATMRKYALLFETAMEDMEVPILGLTKDKAFRDVSVRLNNALDAFPDSPAAKIQRMMHVKKVVNKDKEPGQRSISLGLDLVAMLRPDGFGSLQGYAGYQLPGGNSITFGVHNDADDPQVIAQFGGVRPPLLRVQPKLRVDVEM